MVLIQKNELAPLSSDEEDELNFIEEQFDQWRSH
jgi:hypothetical protein